MARVVVSDLADEDVAKMLDDIAREAGYPAAARYNVDLESLYERLADHPDSCEARPNLGARIRVGVLRPYLVIYRHAEGTDTMSIVRIIHGRRDVNRKLLKGG